MTKGQKVLGIGIVAMISLIATGCTVKGDGSTEVGLKQVDNIEENVSNNNLEHFVQESVGIFEAEEAILQGNVKVVNIPDSMKYSGTGGVEGFEEDTDSCTFIVTIDADGFYDLNFKAASKGGEKHNYISVDGEQLGTIITEKKEITDSILHRVYLSAGEHRITISKYWGWISLDSLEILTAAPIDPDIYEIKADLSNANATVITQQLYNYLCDIYGKKFLSGQFCDTGQYGKEFQVIKKTTGKVPAVLGLDFIEYTPSRVENGSKGYATEYAIDFWNSGGIVTFCWHWNAPSKYLTNEWYRGFYTDATNINLEKIMNGGDEEGYQLLMKDIDAIAKELLILEEEGVPVLWRPLHEASGGWFWWGSSGAEAYKKLYILLYDKLTNEYGLDHLIWVWNGQKADWYPGDEYVDIIGEDIYPGERVYTSQAASYLNAASNYSKEKKLVYLTENGCLFNPDLARRDGAMWGMWCTWQGEFVAKDTSIFSISQVYTEESMVKKVYEDGDVITIEDLPDFSNYRY
ncbi:MAG: glycosyl hydrolase [Anaerocolumna sp.]